LDNVFDLEEERLKDEITRRDAKKVLIQLPEGLKDEGFRLAKAAEEAGAIPIISADPCYGACDLPLCEAETLGVDLIFHYGHTKKPYNTKAKQPIIYIEARCKLDVKDVLTEALEYLDQYDKVGLVTVVQHIHTLDYARALLNKAGKTVMVGDAGRLEYPGQVIGCDYSNAEAISRDVEVFLFIGGGRFHALGLALSTLKPVVVADPYQRRSYILPQEDVNKTIKRRWMEISQAKRVRLFGVIVGLKSGQKALRSALKIRQYLKDSGREASLLAMREITFGALRNFPSIEAFVNTACPRISIDDVSFERPVLTIPETLVMLNKRRWEDLIKGGWFRKDV